MHRDYVPVESLPKEFASGELRVIGYTGVTDNHCFIKFYPCTAWEKEGVVRTARDIHILCIQGHPEYSESIITEMVRQRVQPNMDHATVTDYWGEKGGDYDDEPDDKTATGRRWQKTDGLNVFANVLWKMVGVPSQ
jgi:hypothetical protein